MDTVKDKSPEATDLRTLIGRLTTWVVDLVPSHSRTAPARAPQEAVLDRANVVSSRIKDTNRHMVVLDIDHPTYLVRSSTPGHYHLYIDVPGGIDAPAYENLLKALAFAGVVEHGYVSSAIERGWSAVRLPWIKKGAPEGGPTREREAAQKMADQVLAAKRDLARLASKVAGQVPAESLGKWSVNREPMPDGRPGDFTLDRAIAAAQRATQAAASRRAAATMFTEVDENGEDI